KGNVVILDFWATWCPPCIKSIPHLNQLQKEFESRPVHFFSITYETAGMVEPFLEKHGPEVPIGLDNDFAMFKSYGGWGLPTLYLIDRNGIIASVTGPHNVTAEVIELLLEGKVPEVEQYKGWQDPAGAEEYFRSLLAKGKALEK
ncbi:MAG: redoxin domain-containing protein, partial [Acidobacteriota bacterium]